MKGWIRRTCVGCVVALALGGPLAHAAGGTITFVGAIVEPTCPADTGYIASVAPGTSGPHSCKGSGPESSDAAFYVLKVTTVAASGIADDHALSYFAAYAKAEGANDAGVKLVTQTFQ